MFHLYPEGAANIERAKGRPAHEFFKTFGEQVPKEDWNDPGTKQGIYMIGPHAEYLEAGHAMSGGVEIVRRKLKTALERFAELRKEKSYANQPVPEVTNITVPEVAGKPLVFRVFLRDLPRGGKDDSGRRFEPRDLRGAWMVFTEWAWNVNWIGFDDPGAFVTESEVPVPVSSAVFRRICRECLVSNHVSPICGGVVMYRVPSLFSPRSKVTPTVQFSSLAFHLKCKPCASPSRSEDRVISTRRFLRKVAARAATLFIWGIWGVLGHWVLGNQFLRSVRGRSRHLDCSTVFT